MSKFYYLILCLTMSISTIYALCGNNEACNNGDTENECYFVNGSFACENNTGTCVDVQTCLDYATYGSTINLPEDPPESTVRLKVKTGLTIRRTVDSNSTSGYNGAPGSTMPSGYASNSGFEEGIEIDFSERTNNCSSDSERNVTLIGLTINAGATNGDNSLFINTTSSGNGLLNSLTIDDCILDGADDSGQRTDRETHGIKTKNINSRIKNLTIKNSTIKNFTKGISYTGLGINDNHIIGNSQSLGNIFEENDVHISYPNFNISASSIKLLKSASIDHCPNES